MEFNLDFTTITGGDNLAEHLSDEELEYIGQQVVTWYDTDKNSRSEWEDKYKDALELALQVTQQKDYPWPNAANVKFPLLTVASLQFSARVYPALVTAPDLVKIRKVG